MSESIDVRGTAQVDATDGSPVHSAHIARQPVFDADGGLYGYELLFQPDLTARVPAPRAPGGGSATGGDRTSADELATSTILAAFSEFESHELLDDHPGLIGLTRAFLIGELPLPFGPDQAVLEVMNASRLDELAVVGVHRLAAQGYRLALDGPTRFEAAAVLPSVRILKLDLSHHHVDDVERLVAEARGFEVTCMAAGVADDLMLQQSARWGCELFQGPALGRPETRTIDTLSPQQGVALQLIGRLADPETTPEDVEVILRQDPALSLKLLKIVNSAGFGLNRPISGIRDAVVFVGMAKLRAWMMLLALSGAGSAQHQLSDALGLARTCEQLARARRLPAETAFTAGLLQGIADALGLTGEQLLHGLPVLADDLSAALRGEEQPLTTVLRAVRCYLGRDVAGLIATGVPGSDVAQAYLSAMVWTHTMMAATAQ